MADERSGLWRSPVRRATDMLYRGQIIGSFTDEAWANGGQAAFRLWMKKALARQPDEVRIEVLASRGNLP
jgi:hypothetical protein